MKTKEELIKYIREHQYDRPYPEDYHAASLELLKIKEAEREAFHEKNEPCEDEECQECCGEYYGHEYDADEGGYCACGAHPYA